MAIKRGDKLAIYRRDPALRNGCNYRCVGFARVLCVSDGYAMVRFPRAMPFVESVKQLEEWQTNPPRAKEPTHD